MGSKKRYQSDHRADTKGQPISGLPHVVADSPAHLSLSTFDRAVFAEILRRFNGFNNGDIAITYEEIGARLTGPNRSAPNNARIAAAIGRLVLHGLIDEPLPQSWMQRRARRYRLTFISSGKAPPYRQATNEYLRFTPDRAKIDSDRPSPRKPQSGDARSPGPVASGDARSPRVSENGSFASSGVSSSGDAGSLVICKPYQGPRLEAGEIKPDPPLKPNEPISTIVAGPWPDPSCEACGKPFVAGDRGKPKRFCTEQCRKRAEVQRRNDRRRGQA